jgi:hypothetical protein
MASRDPGSESAAMKRRRRPWPVPSDPYCLNAACRRAGVVRELAAMEERP